MDWSEDSHCTKSYSLQSSHFFLHDDPLFCDCSSGWVTGGTWQHNDESCTPHYHEELGFPFQTEDWVVFEPHTSQSSDIVDMRPHHQGFAPVEDDWLGPPDVPPLEIERFGLPDDDIPHLVPDLLPNCERVIIRACKCPQNSGDRALLWRYADRSPLIVNETGKASCPVRRYKFDEERFYCCHLCSGSYALIPTDEFAHLTALQIRTEPKRLGFLRKLIRTTNLPPIPDPHGQRPSVLTHHLKDLGCTCYQL